MIKDEIGHENSSGYVFADMGFWPVEAEELAAKTALILAIENIMGRQPLTQKPAAKVCGTDPPTLSKVLRGRMESVTIDRRASWLTALGRDVESRCNRPRSRHALLQVAAVA